MNEDDRDKVSQTLSLPPLYSGVAVPRQSDPLTEALGLARQGDASGTLVYAEREDRLDAALVLGPEMALRQSLPVIYVFALAAVDALGATIPPQIGVYLHWPDRILVNQALAGGLALSSPTQDLAARPDWLVGRLLLDVRGRPAPDDLSRTSLYLEGAVEVTTLQILESFARHFLSWLNRWEAEGLAAIEAPWLGRAIGREDSAIFETPAGKAEGRILGLSPDGNLLIEGAEGRSTADLAWLLAGPSWQLAPTP